MFQREHESKIILETPTKQREKKQREKQTDVFIPPIQPNAFSFSRPKLTCDDVCPVTKTKPKYDPFVSEDFQVTPLVRYSKKRAKPDVEMVNRKKHCDRLKHGKIEKKHTNTFEIDKVHSFKQSQFTSTPLKEMPENIGLKKREGLDCFASISPIFTEAPFSKDADDGFRFKPRLDVSKQGISAFGIRDKSIAGTGNVNSYMYTQSYMYKSHEENASFERSNKQTNVNEYDPGKLNRSLSIPNESASNFTPRSRLLSYSSDFEYDATMTKSYQDESVYDSSLSVGKISSESENTVSGSLSKYRHIHGQKPENPIFQLDTFPGNEVSLKHAEKEEDLDFDNNVPTTIPPKPTFTDLELEFQYKPLKTGKMKLEAASEIMNMHKELRNEKQQEVGGIVGKSGDSLCDESRRPAGGSV